MPPLAARLWALCALAATFWVCGFAHAHPMPGSVALIDFTVAGARIDQDVPLEELEHALKASLVQQGETAVQIIGRHGEMLRRYAAAHVSVVAAASGAPWAVRVLDLQGYDAEDGPRVRFQIALVAPDGQAAGSVVLRDDIVAHEVVSHYIYVYVRSDWTAGQTEAQQRLVGTVHAGTVDIAIARTGGFWRGLRSVMSTGMEHIATGSDHLMFLFALVLVAPVAAMGGSWYRRRALREAGLRLAGTVTAFTAGHSLTLALGALGLVHLPSKWVELAIALSVLITAAHALRPLFAGRELLLTAAFGLVHGLAFADTLLGRDLGRSQALWTLVGFNTGIELAQLGLLFLVTPWLLLLARTRAYAAFRVGGATCAALLALGWTFERLTGLTSPTSQPLAWLEAHPLPLLAALAAGTLAARAWGGNTPTRTSRLLQD